MPAKEWKAGDTRKLEALMKEFTSSSEIYESGTLAGFTLRQISLKMYKIRTGSGSSSRDAAIAAGANTVSGPWTDEETEIVTLMMERGKDAAQIAQSSKVPGRSYKSIKSKIQRILSRQGRTPYRTENESADDVWARLNPDYKGAIYVGCFTQTTK